MCYILKTTAVAVQLNSEITQVIPTSAKKRNLFYIQHVFVIIFDP
jgi:hypothetical protein